MWGSSRYDRPLAFAVLLCLISVYTACGGGSSSTQSVSPTLTALTIAPANPSVGMGVTQQLKATGQFSNGSSQDVTASTSWSSSDTTKATFSPSTAGLVNGIAVGSCTVTATYQGKSSTATLTILSIAGLSIGPANPTIPVGGTQQFTATATFQNGSTAVVTSLATWSSSDNTRATIQNTGQANPGLATAVSAASPAPNIQATFEGSTALTLLYISSNAPQNGLSLGVVNPSLSPGATLQIVSVADYTDGSSKPVTSLTAWTSSNPAVATVSSATPGLVSALSAGQATITATDNGFSATAALTVSPSAETVPLSDMTQSGQNYLGFVGGLYGANSNTVPSGHDFDGKALAAQITPLDQNGNPSASGTVVFLGIGMSNALIEFGRFITDAAVVGSGVNQTNLGIENGAHGAVTACPWTFAQGLPTICGGTGVPAENQYDRVRDTVLATATTAPNVPAGCGTTTSPCLTESQVQVIWMTNANPDPGLRGYDSLSSTTNCATEASAANFTTEACRYESQMGAIVRAAKSRYPNLKLIFFSSRIYAGYAVSTLNPEPYAYEYGFSGQWLVTAQINQMNNSTVDPVAGDLSYSVSNPQSSVGAWVGWSSYLWADGTTKRSDGLNWCNGQLSSPCNGEQDFATDGTHPSSSNPDTPPYDGAYKFVSGTPWGLMQYFQTSPYTCPWFSATPATCP